ncbi:NAD-binding protein, partial [Novosphingobium sp. 1949]
VAAAGKLNVLAAGAPEAMAKAAPALEAIAGKVWELGAEPGAANAVKIACNALITMAIEGMAEGGVLAETAGVDRARFLEVLTGTIFGAPVYQNYARIIVEGEYQPGFKATLGLKDLRLASALARDSGASLPVLEAVHARMADAIEAGNGERDWGVMADYTFKTAARIGKPEV